MSNVIKLKESDIYDIANKIIAEQLQQSQAKEEEPKGIGPYPPKNSPEARPGEPQQPSKPIKVYAASEQIVKTKYAVEGHLDAAIKGMNALVRMSNLNPGIGKIIPGLESIQQKFDEIFGIPDSETESK